MFDINKWMPNLIGCSGDNCNGAMPARVKNIISLLVVVTLAYAGYTLLQVRRRTSYSVLSDFQQNTVASYLIQSGTGRPKDQGLTAAVDAEGAPIDVRSDKCRRQRYVNVERLTCLLYTSPSPRDRTRSRMPSSA